MQLSFELLPRAEGERLGELCAEKASRVADFDATGAGKFILGWLHRHGPTSGEKLTAAATEHGFRAHDSRAFGPVYAALSRKGLIRCVGYCARERGHGTAGGRIWAAQQ
jgi:hypothetical protein